MRCKELGAEEDQEVDEGENQRNTAGGVADDKEPAQQDSVNNAQPFHLHGD